MKINKGFFVKVLILLVYLLPFVTAYLKGETVIFQKIYYAGIIVSALSFISFKDELLNNWLFAISLLLFLLNLILVFMYLFS